MAQPEPSAKAARTPGRLRAAWLVLMGERTTPLQIEAEWAEYKEAFTTLLTRFNASLARQAAAEMRKLNEEPVEVAPSAGGRDKNELMARARAQGLGLPPIPDIRPQGPQREVG